VFRNLCLSSMKMSRLNNFFRELKLLSWLKMMIKEIVTVVVDSATFLTLFPSHGQKLALLT